MARSVFVASLLLVMFLGISEPAAALQTQPASRAHAVNPLDAQNCSVYPIAIHVNSLVGLLPGNSIGDLFNGSGSGNFGWLRWTDNNIPGYPNPNSELFLLAEFQDPGLAFTVFEDALDAPPDTFLNAGDSVWGLYGVVNSNSTRDVLAGLVDAGTTLRVPVWDSAGGTGSNGYYHVQRFVQIRLAGFRLASGSSYGTGCVAGWNCINAVFVGEDPAACPEPADLTIAKSASPDAVSPGQALTYTLAFSNAGIGPATGVVISDALPLVLTDTHFTSAGALITPTVGVTYAWQVQDLASNQGGIITVTGQVRPDLAGGFTFTNSAAITGTSAESDTGNNAGVAQVWVEWLPLIFSPDGTTFEVNSDIRVRLEQHRPNSFFDIYLGTRLLCTLRTDGLGMADTITLGVNPCFIPSDFLPCNANELWSATPWSGIRVAGNVFVDVIPASLPMLLIREGCCWPAGSPIVLQLRGQVPYTQYELYFNGALIGAATTNAFGDLDFPWTIPAGTSPRERPDSYRIESHVVGSGSTVAYADIHVTTPQIVVQGGNVWPPGASPQAGLHRHAPNHTYEVRCNGNSAGTLTTGSEGSSVVGIWCTIPVTAPNSPPYYTITSYDAGVLIGQVDITVLDTKRIHLPIIFRKG
jgi:uncharacterized repeat protein (TIGR01451 family)